MGLAEVSKKVSIEISALSKSLTTTEWECFLELRVDLYRPWIFTYVWVDSAFLGSVSASKIGSQKIYMNANLVIKIGKYVYFIVRTPTF